jgi:hypothetical protein
VPAVSPEGAGSAHVAGAYVGVGTAEAERRRLTSAEEISPSSTASSPSLRRLWRRTTDSATPIALPRSRIGRAALAPFGSNPIVCLS